MAKEKTVYVCSNCGQDSPKWVGKCPSCGEWNTYVEEIVRKEPVNRRPVSGIETQKPVTFNEIIADEEPRINLHDAELNRVLGGGLVPGSLVLIGGEPGIGKSTLVMQTVLRMPEKKILYVSGEESARQLKLRADRLSEVSSDCFIVCETSLEQIYVHIKNTNPDLVIIDSIQTMFTPDIDSAPGSVSQVRTCGNELMKLGKVYNIPIFIVAHVTKSGELAGPKTVEHMVDCVLDFKGERNQEIRILRCYKNRFGNTSEIGAFEMAQQGLIEIENLSKTFLEDVEDGIEGAIVTAVYEGSRPLLLEVQALSSAANVGFARRSAIGVDFARLNMIIAVLEKKAGLSLLNEDIYVNIVGGLKPEGTYIDLAVALAIYSTYRGMAAPARTIVIGEIGLTGELRTVQNADKIVREAVRMGFKQIIMPVKNAERIKPAGEMKIIGVKNIQEAIRVFKNC